MKFNCNESNVDIGDSCGDNFENYDVCWGRVENYRSSSNVNGYRESGGHFRGRDTENVGSGRIS